ncbi:MAG: MFS transporter [Alphaproteobacteria bacterium]|nr:MFS transporter [Alphaproteobacteria bacterium]
MAEAAWSSTEAALENQRLGGLQIRVVLLCALIQALDGYDINAIGMAVPSLSHIWNLPGAAFSRTFVMSSVGILFGALACGPAGDRLGRKPVLLAGTAFIGVFSLASVFAHSLDELTLYRFLTGIGIGCIMAVTVALTSDYTSQRNRALVIMMMFCGNPAGGFVGGQIVAQLLPYYGWQCIFVLGGAVPLILLPILMLWLPESPRFLVARGPGSPRRAALLARLDLAAAETAPRQVDVAVGNPVRMLFADGYAPRTILVWIVYFANLLDIYLISYWMPEVLHLSGLAPADAVFAASLQGLGGCLSTIYLGPLIRRYGSDRIIALNLAIGVVFVAGIAFGHLPYPALLIAILGTGAATIGSMLGINGFCATLYPARMRTTGVGWALGVGRLGGIGGPAIGGFLLSLGWPPPQIFLSACGMALVAAVAIAVLGFLTIRTRRMPATEVVP